MSNRRQWSQSGDWRSRTNLVAAMMVCLILCVCLPAPAATWYVAPNGSDSAAGSAAAPFQTIMKGFASCGPGDTEIVRAGANYVGLLNEFDIHITGTQAKPIIVEADPAAAPGSVIITMGALASGQVGQDGIDFEPGCNYVILKGLTVDARKLTRAGIRICQGTGCQILNCKVINAQTFSIYTSHTTDCVIDSCEAYGATGTGQAGHGIYVANSATRPVVTNNKIHNNGGEGIHMNGDGNMGAPGVIVNATVTGNQSYGNGEVGLNCDGIQNSLIDNNQIWGNARHGIALYKEAAAGASTGNTITHNTVDQAGSSGAAISLINGATGNVVQDNIFFGGANGDIVAAPDSRSGLKSDYNILSNPAKIGDYTGATVGLASWQGTGQDKHSTQSSPAAILTAASANPPDMTLKPGGPAIGGGTPAGTNIGAGNAGATPPPLPPAIVSTTPAANATAVSSTAAITIIFNEALDAATVSGSNITLANGTATIAAAVGYSAANYSVTVTPAATLADATKYTVSVKGVKDVAGDLLAGTSTWSFTTGVTIPPPPTNAQIIAALQAEVLSLQGQIYQMKLGDIGSAANGPMAGAPDGHVDIADLNIVTSHWQMVIPPAPAAAITGSGGVTAASAVAH